MNTQFLNLKNNDSGVEEGSRQFHKVTLYTLYLGQNE